MRRMLILLRRSVVEGFKGLFAHGLMSLASMGTVAVSLTVLAFFLVLAANLTYVADVLEEQVEIVGYCHPSFDQQWEKTLLDKIESMPGVRDAVFVSKESALERLRDQFGSQAELLDAVEEYNPLRDSVEVTVVSSADTGAVVRALSQLDSIQDVAYQREVVDKIHALTESLRAAGTALVFVLGGVTFLLISNTVRLSIYTRRQEMEVMRLVGASSGFIWGPLVVEGMFLGLIGAAVAGGIIAWGYIDLVAAVESSIPFMPLVGPRPLLENLMQLLLLCGVVIGLISSWFSVWRYVRA